MKGVKRCGLIYLKISIKCPNYEYNIKLKKLKKEIVFKMSNFGWFPLNFKRNVFLERFTRGRAVVVGKDRHEFYLYFMMTDTSVLLFNKYLNDFENVFWFNE